MSTVPLPVAFHQLLEGHLVILAQGHIESEIVAFHQACPSSTPLQHLSCQAKCHPVTCLPHMVVTRHLLHQLDGSAPSMPAPTHLEHLSGQAKCHPVTCLPQMVVTRHPLIRFCYTNFTGLHLICLHRLTLNTSAARLTAVLSASDEELPHHRKGCWGVSRTKVSAPLRDLDT